MRLCLLGACVPQPASDTNRTIHSNSDVSKNEKLRAGHFPGGGDDSTELARQF